MCVHLGLALGVGGQMEELRRPRSGIQSEKVYGFSSPTCLMHLFALNYINYQFILFMQAMIYIFLNL